MMILTGTITLVIVMSGGLRVILKVNMLQRSNGRMQIDFFAGCVRLSGADMHPNHRLLLDVAAYLQPTSVHEVGAVAVISSKHKPFVP